MKSLRQFVCQIIDAKGTIRGTGFYIHPDGYIATCHHVVENCNGKVRVGIFGESEPIESEIVIDDRDYDIAVLNIDREKCKSLPLNSEWEIGDEVFSHGFSVDHLLTFHDAGFPVDSKLVGTTTPSNRKIEVIVLDKTEVNYGLSGAPAFNRRTGKVIGIITLKYDEGRKALVIPIDRLFEKFSKLRSNRKVNLQTYDGKHFVCAENGGGGEVVANRTAANIWETFTMSGRLEYGGEISLQTYDGKHFVCAENGGGGKVVANRTAANIWETFTIISHDGKPDGSPIANGSKIAFQTFNCQYYICAEGGGGGDINATRFKDLQWETFTVIFVP